MRDALIDKKIAMFKSAQDVDIESPETHDAWKALHIALKSKAASTPPDVRFWHEAARYVSGQGVEVDIPELLDFLHNHLDESSNKTMKIFKTREQMYQPASTPCLTCDHPQWAHSEIYPHKCDARGGCMSNCRTYDPVSRDHPSAGVHAVPPKINVDEQKRRPKISVERVRQIVAEEVRRVHEDVDHAGISNVVKLAGKVLDAIKKFDDAATGRMKSAVTPHLDQLHKTLEDMVSTPGSYVDVIKQEPKVVSLRPVKTKGYNE